MEVTMSFKNSGSRLHSLQYRPRQGNGALAGGRQIIKMGKKEIPLIFLAQKHLNQFKIKKYEYNI